VAGVGQGCPSHPSSNFHHFITANSLLAAAFDSTFDSPGQPGCKYLPRRDEMNAYAKKLITRLAIMSAFGPLCMAQSGSDQRNCKPAKGNFIDVWNGAPRTDGTIVNGGFLNGTTFTSDASGAFPTSIPNTVSYNVTLTLTTHQGQLKLLNVYLYDFRTGIWTAMGWINPNTSTGRFAGATGVLYFNGKTVGTVVPISYPSEITGEVCLTK
jgi:hypothetical protein